MNQPGPRLGRIAGVHDLSGPLPLPGNRDGYDSKPHFNTKKYLKLLFEKMDYRDTAIVAFREPEPGTSKLGDERKKSLPAKSNRLYAHADPCPPLNAHPHPDGDSHPATQPNAGAG